MLKIWFKLLLKHHQKRKLNSFVNYLGLTLGFTGLTLMLLYLNEEKSYHQWHPKKETIYRVLHESHAEKEIWSTATFIEGPTYKEEIPEVEDYFLTQNYYENRIVRNEKKSIYSEKILHAQSNFFDFFPYPIMGGNPEKLKESKTHVSVSDDFAKKIFSTTDVVGKNLFYNSENYIITSVYQIPEKSYFQPEMIVPLRNLDIDNWDWFSKTLFCKITENADPKLVSDKMDQTFSKYRSSIGAKEEGLTLEEYEEKLGMSVFIEPLSNLHLKTIADNAGPERKANYQMIMILLGLSILLLIISGLNFINLATVTLTQRSKEIGIKKCLGTSPFVLSKYYFFEVLIFTIIALFSSFILIEIILPYFNQFMNIELHLFDWKTLLQTLFIVLIFTLFISAIPSIYFYRIEMIKALKGQQFKTKKGKFFRHFILGTQFLISGFFIIGILVIQKQVDFMMSKDLGFSGDQILIVDFHEEEDNLKKFDLAKKELIKHSSIHEISTNSVPPGDDFITFALNYQDQIIDAKINLITPGYLEMYDIPILKGRSFKENIASDTSSNIIINEAFAKRLNFYDNPIGKKVKLGIETDKYDGWSTIVGMVKDYHIHGFDNEIKPMILTSFKNVEWYANLLNSIQFKISSENIPETIAYIEKFWKKNYQKEFPFKYEFADEKFAKSYKEYQQQMTLFEILSSLVILIATLGLFALCSLTIQERYKEIAIRKTLGATTKEMMIPLMQVFFKVVIISSILVFPIAFYMMQLWLDNFIYRIHMPILPYIITPIFLTFLVLIVVGTKAFIATKLKTTHYLKYE
ncbi:ABC transporter permease [Aureivirga sp. CE67]|uniref:ABC transporter permease n=1 Tax=Aureivirga sp. CE67 TaxID=1788983 RepID=UPI0018CB9E14|nr:FtsX-like permease family protein [Aureivirga sp. CE67]